MMPMVSYASPEFINMVRRAVERARTAPDDSIQYLASEEYGIPVYAQYEANPEQARAGGCAECTYLGLWANRWNGYPESPHGLVWLFERGIRDQGGDVRAKVYEVLTHEFGHALQRDHVLDAMESRRARGEWPPRPHTGGRGCCPGS